MIKKNLFKKLLTVGLAAAITAAMPVVAMAEEIYLGGNGWADCYITGSDGYGYASTVTYANYEPDYICAYVELKLDTYNSSNVVDYYLDDEWAEPTYGKYAAASAKIDENVPANLRTEIYSYHYAAIDDMDDYCNLIVGY